MDRFTQYYKSVRPVLFLCKLSGLFPIGVDRHGSNVSLTTRNSRYFTAARMVYLTVAAILLPIWIKRWRGSIPKEVVAAMSYMAILVEFYRINNSYMRRRVIVRMVEQLPDIDEDLEACDVTVDYAKEGRKNLMSLARLTAVNVLGTAFTAINTGLRFQELSAYCVELFAKSMLKHYLSVLFESVKERFEKINLKLLDGGRPIPLVRCHFRLSNLCNMAMKCYGFDYMAILAALLLHLGGQCIALYLYVVHEQSYWKPIGSCLWIANELVDLVAFVRICVETCRIANKTALILHEMHHKGRFSRKEDEEEAHSISLMFLNQKLQINAAGFCDIDYPLVFGIVTAVISYMMIFIQSDLTNLMHQRSLGNAQ